LAKHPVAVIGSTLVGPTQAIAPLFKDGPVLYGSTPLFYPDKGGFIFSAGASSRFNTAATMRYFRMKGLTRFAFITTTDASGQDYLRTLDFALALPENKNVTVVDREVFNPSDISAASQAAHIKSSTAQVVYAYATGAPFGTVLRALSDAAVDLPVITAGPNINPVLLDRFRSFLPKADLVIGGASFLNRDRKPGDPLKGPIDDFYQELAGLGVRQPNVAHAFTWDPARIIVGGLRKLGPNATPSQLRDYIAGLNGFAGVSGVYDFRIGDQHGLTQDAQVVIQYDPSAPGNLRVVSRQGGAPL
jgi:ABC-type branched-subunit amino acid transport system substrate-binding protein